ncbi:MAG: DNA primase [Muribaculaceae bacterium]
MIDQATVEQIRNAANIVDVVADYVTLHRSGANYKGLCPFHNERTPSFIVSPAKNYCHCFGCGKGGDPIGFLKELNNYTYREALIHLANKFHIEVKEVDLTNEEIAERQKRQSYLTLCDFVSKYYQQQLATIPDNNATAMSHLNSFGLHEAAVKRFGIGYADGNADSLVDSITKAGFNLSNANDLGLVAPLANGMGDVINNAIVMPVYNKTGKVTGFAWQGINAGDNALHTSPRSPIFNPQESAFGIFQANHAISKAKSCFVVDTPFDVMAMHQNGFENTISPLGESLDRYLINDLAKSVKDDSVTIVTAFRQQAQLTALLRIADQFAAQGINIFVANTLQPELSTAASLASCSGSDWMQHIESTKKDIITWKAELLLNEAGDNVALRIKAIHNTLRTIKAMRDESSKRIYLNVLSQLTKFPAETLNKEMDQL